MIKYKASFFYEVTVKAIECNRETKQSVFFGAEDNICERRETKYYRYFDTFQEAKDFLIRHLEKQIEYTRRKLENLEMDYEKIFGMNVSTT